ncbi:hypothetical protein [Nocardioides bruguierae]|uniref:hypothetical protein n=1 Tax=Nocardioides bruguierae TaxID=2945102 RepID=UPI002020C938|nr:hypothetical protein [Nocardioides bruguierae]MCL8025402.1 hypothetical protein [Nocardioides bruguierae]
MPEVSTEVVAEHGQWAVYLLVLGPDGVDRRRLAGYRSASLARTAARVVERSANRRRVPVEEPDGTRDAGSVKDEGKADPEDPDRDETG